MLRSRVTVYLPRSLWCANHWNKLNKWNSKWGSSLNPYRLWITIILNITYLIIRILKGVDTKLRINLWTFWQAVKDCARLLLSPTIGNRLFSVINRLESSTCYHYTIFVTQNRYRTSRAHITAPRPCQHAKHTAPRPQVRYSTTAKSRRTQMRGRPVFRPGLRAGPIGSSWSGLDVGLRPSI